MYAVRSCKSSRNVRLPHQMPTVQMNHHLYSRSFWRRQTPSRKKKLAVLADLKQTRASAYDEIMALDHTMTMSGCGLQSYMAADDDGDWTLRATSPLKLGESRQWVSVPDSAFPHVPPHFLMGLGKKSLITRAGIAGAGKQKRWELQEFVGERPMVGLIGDEGSFCFAAIWFLLGFGKQRVRGGWLRDPGHRRWRNWNLSVDDCGWRPHLQEGLMIMNLAFGPYLSEAWHKMIQESLQAFIRHGGANDHLFMLFYEYICADLDMTDDELFGQLEHRNKVLGIVVECFIFEKQRVPNAR